MARCAFLWYRSLQLSVYVDHALPKEMGQANRRSSPENPELILMCASSSTTMTRKYIVDNWETNMVHDMLKMIDQGLVVPAIAISGTLVFFLAFLITGPVIFYYNFRLKQYLRKNSPELWEMYSSTSGKIRRKCGRLLGESEDPIILKYIRTPIRCLKCTLGAAVILVAGVAVAILMYAK